MLSQKGERLRVRVGVVVAEGEGEPRLAGPGQDVEEIWLGDIAQTGRGFSGVAANTPERLRHIRQGQKIGFELRHIQGWTLDVEAAPPHGAAARESRTNFDLT
jgi:uncharacterized protein YegJ (DUF2314 family)